MKVDYQYTGSLRSPKNLADTFAYFTNYSTLFGSHFPTLNKFEPSGEAHRWQFEELNYAGKRFTLVLVTEIEASPPNGLTLKSIPGEGTGDLDGEFTFEETAEGTTVQMNMALESDLPISSFLGAAFKPLLKNELEKIFEEFVRNVELALKQ